MKTLIENKNFDLSTDNKNWLWFRSISHKFEILFGIRTNIICLSIHSSFIEITILKIGIKFWTN